MDVLVDNNILSSLAKTNRLALLDQLFDTVSTVPAVLDELHHGRLSSNPFVERIESAKRFNGGWLTVDSPTSQELELADAVADHALSRVDAKCIAVSETREKTLLTDDSHVGQICRQRGTAVWELKLFVEACIQHGLLTEAELGDLITDLEEDDGYRFSEQDRDDLFTRFDR